MRSNQGQSQNTEDIKFVIESIEGFPSRLPYTFVFPLTSLSYRILNRVCHSMSSL